MTDAEKIEIAQKILGAAWECVPQEDEAAFWRGVLVAVEVVVGDGD